MVYNKQFTDFVQGVCPCNKCNSRNPNVGDGEYASYGQQTRYACKNKNCPRHWIRYGKRLAKRLSKEINPYIWYYHIRLSCKMRLPKGDKHNYSLRKFKDKMVKIYGKQIQILAFTHYRRQMHHYHLLIGTNDQLDIETARQEWRKHIPNKTIDWKNSFVYMSEYVKPENFVHYCIFGPKLDPKNPRKKPRVLPPWIGPNCPRTPAQIFPKPPRQPKPPKKQKVRRNYFDPSKPAEASTV